MNANSSKSLHFSDFNDSNDVCSCPVGVTHNSSEGNVFTAVSVLSPGTFKYFWKKAYTASLFFRFFISVYRINLKEGLVLCKVNSKNPVWVRKDFLSLHPQIYGVFLITT